MASIDPSYWILIVEPLPGSRSSSIVTTLHLREELPLLIARMFIADKSPSPVPLHGHAVRRTMRRLMAGRSKPLGSVR